MSWEGNAWRGAEPTVQELLDGLDPSCSCCDAEGVPLAAYRLTGGSRPFVRAREEGRPPFKLLCGLCASTLVGAWNEYQEQHDRDTLEAMKTVCHVGNAVLRAIEALGNNLLRAM